MNSYRGGLTVAMACVALAGCHFPALGGHKAPTGQVVATVGNREITLRELNAEMGGATFPDARTRKASEQIALRNIVGRIILADAAKSQGLDQTPEFAIQKQRAIDTVLAGALQQKLIKAVPQPSKDEVQQFMSAHPDIFLERKIFAVDQIRMPRPSDAVIKALEPLKTLEQVEAVLKQNNVPYQRNAGSLDTVGADPRLVDKIVKLPADELFVLPSNNGLLVNQIRGSRVEPFTGDPAANYAEKVMVRQRTQESVERSFRDIMAKAARTVQFNKDYAPPKGTPLTVGPPAAAAQAH